MRKLTKAIIALVVVIGGITAASWWCGRYVEDLYNEQYALLSRQIPTFTVVEREYKRGLFTSSETVTVRITQQTLHDMFGSIESEDLDGQNQDMPAQLVIRSKILHGPFPGLSGFGAAHVNMAFTFDERVEQRLGRIFKDKTPLESQVKVAFNGDTTVFLTSPAVEYADEACAYAWGGMKVVVRFTRELDRIHYDFDLPQLNVQRDDQTFAFSGLKGEAEQRQIFANHPFFFSGKASFNLTEFSAPDRRGEVITLRDLSFAADTPVEGDYMDMSVKISGQVYGEDDAHYGPLVQDLELKHLHAPSLAVLFETMRAILNDPAKQAALRTNPSMLFDSIVEPMHELVKHEPQFNLNRYAFSDAEFRMEMSAHGGVKDGVATFVSPAASFTNSDEQFSITWKDVRFAVDFEREKEHLFYELDIPALEAVKQGGGSVKLTGLSGTADMYQVFEDLSAFNVVKLALKLSELGFSGEAQRGGASNIQYSLETPLEGDFMDIVARLDVERFSIDEQQWGPLQFESAWQHLHARALAQLTDLAKLRSSLSSGAKPSQEEQMLFMTTLLDSYQKLVLNQPEISIRKMHVKMPDGDFDFHMLIGLDNVTNEDVEAPLRLLTKLKAEGAVSLPEALSLGAPQDKVQMLVQRGYVQAADKQLSTTFLFKEGQWSLNGKPFDPALLR